MLYNELVLVHTTSTKLKIRNKYNYLSIILSTVSFEEAIIETSLNFSDKVHSTIHPHERSGLFRNLTKLWSESSHHYFSAEDYCNALLCDTLFREYDHLKN